MSHLPQRKENNCLNCGAEVIGRFCHDCGQENIEPKETVWHLISHFLSDITHFDGKFFSSLKLLILKPGFLSKQYMLGRRAAYLNPIRMYLFTSAIFFLIFFAVINIEKSFHVEMASEQMDSVRFAKISKELRGKVYTKDELRKKLDSTGVHFSLTPGQYKSKEQYDSILKSGVKKHNWIERHLIYKSLELNKKYNNNGQQIIIALLNTFFHSLPQMLFILLPLFAIILKLIYIRRKQFYYTDHIIFTIHFYIFIFILILASMGIGKIERTFHFNWEIFFAISFFILGLIYFYKALRNFYLQRRAKTIFKFFILLFMFSFTTLSLFIVFFLLSIFRT